MLNWSALSAGSKALLGVGMAGVIGVSGYLIFQSGKAPEPVATQVEVAAVTQVAEPQADAVAQATTQVILPQFDLVRIDALGNATVAGSAEAAQTVSFRIDGVDVAQTEADAQGKFAALFTLAPNPNPRLMTLVAFGADGQEIAAQNSVAISPIAEPAPQVQVATAQGAVASQNPAAPSSPGTQVETAAPAAPAEAPVALVLSAKGVEAIINDPVAVQPADAAPQGVTIAAITYAPNGGVILSGIGAANAPLRIYLDQAAVAEATVQADGNWSVELSDVAAGIYTLRVDQLTAEGKVEARFETPFKRETSQALAAVSAPEPMADASVDATSTQSAEATATPALKAAEPQAAQTAAVEPAAAEATGEAAPAAAEATPNAIDPLTVRVDTTEAAATDSSEPKPAEIALVAKAAAPEVKAVTADVGAPTAPITITVQPGFTLWRIAQEQLGEGIMYVQVFKANQNNIADPDLIYPGQIFTIPTPLE